MHLCVSNPTIIGSDNGLSPGGCQAIIWTNTRILWIGPLGTNFSEISIEFNTFSSKKMHLKMLSAKWRLFPLGLYEFTILPIYGYDGTHCVFSSFDCGRRKISAAEFVFFIFADFGINFCVILTLSSCHLFMQGNSKRLYFIWSMLYLRRLCLGACMNKMIYKGMKDSCSTYVLIWRNNHYLDCQLHLHHQHPCSLITHIPILNIMLKSWNVLLSKSGLFMTICLICWGLGTLCRWVGARKMKIHC